MSLQRAFVNEALPQTLEQCQHVVEGTQKVLDSRNRGCNEDDQALVDEFRFQCKALREKAQLLAREVQNIYTASEVFRSRHWAELQTVTQNLLSDCGTFLHEISTETFGDNNLPSAPVDLSVAKVKTKRPKFLPSSRTGPSNWTTRDLHRIEDVISFCRALKVVRELDSLLCRDIVWWTPDAGVRTLEDQVYHGVYHSNCFKLHKSVADSSHASGLRHPVLQTLVNLAMDILQLNRLSAEIGPVTTTRQNPPLSLSTREELSPRQRPVAVADTENERVGDKASPEPLSLPTNLSSLTLATSPITNQGNGAPDCEDHLEPTVTPSFEAVIAKEPHNSQRDLGQQIQALLRQQLEQDQRTRRILERRVHQLEDQCKFANERAEHESGRADKASLRVGILENEMERALESVKHQHAREIAKHKEEFDQCLEERVALQDQLEVSRREVERLSRDLGTQICAAKEMQEQLRQSIRQKEQVQEIVKTWNSK